MEKSVFTKAWEAREKQSPPPRRMRNLFTMPFEELKNKVLSQDPEWVQKMIDSLYSGDVYILKGAYPQEFMLRLRKELHEHGKKTPSEFYSMLEGVKNFHRIIDAEIAKKYTFESIKHSYYFFPWNQDTFQVFSTAYPPWRIIKQLSGLRPDEYEKNTPKDGMVDRLQIVHYPSGAGRIETHSDPYQVHRLIISCFMSKRGADYRSGGVYFLDQQNKKIDAEPLLDIGDMQIYFPTILHGVDTIDEGTSLNWLAPEGRWWFGPFSNSSNHVDKRHVGFGVKNIDTAQTKDQRSEEGKTEQKTKGVAPA